MQDWLAERIRVDYGLPPAASRELVETRKVLPVLDGLDEMDPDPDKGALPVVPERAIAALNRLNTYFDGNVHAPVVLTCRAARYRQLVEAGAALSNAGTIRILDLDPARITAYLDACFAATPERRRAWDPVLDTLERPVGRAARGC